jgi:coenzyme F420-reducing hydrogenase gamma subunit
MIRYDFNIKTRTGQRVENISIMAGSQSDAERRLRQMYQRCEIMECNAQKVPRRVDTLDVEFVIGMISDSEPLTVTREAANETPAAVVRLRNKAGTH